MNSIRYLCIVKSSLFKIYGYELVTNFSNLAMDTLTLQERGPRNWIVLPSECKEFSLVTDIFC